MVRKDLYRSIQLGLQSADMLGLEHGIDSGYLCINLIYELNHLHVLSRSSFHRRRIRGL